MTEQRSDKDRTAAQAAFRKWWSDNGIASMATEENAWRFFRAGWHANTAPLPELGTSVEAVPVADILAEIKHIEENGGRVKALPGMEDEGRCRELCAMYLREFVTSERARRQLVGLMRSSEELAAKMRDLASVPSTSVASKELRVCEECNLEMYEWPTDCCIGTCPHRPLRPTDTTSHKEKP